MKSKFSKVSLVILPGGYSAIGLLGSFLWTNPALASMIETDTATEPTQEVLGASVEIRKPTITPMQPFVSNPQIQESLQDISGLGYYLADVPWVIYFYDEYGFHGTYWHNNFGTPMSRGCVTPTIDDAKWLYDWASVGTKVSVHE